MTLKVTFWMCGTNSPPLNEALRLGAFKCVDVSGYLVSNLVSRGVGADLGDVGGRLAARTLLGARLRGGGAPHLALELLVSELSTPPLPKPQWGFGFGLPRQHHLQGGNIKSTFESVKF